MYPFICEQDESQHFHVLKPKINLKSYKLKIVNPIGLESTKY